MSRPALGSLTDAAAVASAFGSLSSRTFLVTGAASGFGLECARALASAGGTVVLACRPGAKAEAAAATVRAAAAGGTDTPPRVHLIPLDLASPASVRACAAAYRALPLPRGGALDALVLNAGVLGQRFGSVAPGVEPTLQTNLLGHALLHALLAPALEAAGDGARVAVTASGSHYRVTGETLEWAAELPPREAGHDVHRAYAFSNLCRVAWARGLARRVKYPVVSYHPACSAATGMGQHLSALDLARAVFLLVKWELRGFLEGQTPAQGARTQTWVAVAPRDALTPSGSYLSGNATDGPLGQPVKPSAIAASDEAVERVMAFVDAFVAKEIAGA